MQYRFRKSGESGGNHSCDECALLTSGAEVNGVGTNGGSDGDCFTILNLMDLSEVDMFSEHV
jgi:hypothetical protein